MWKSWYRLLLIPDIISASKESFFFKTTTVILMQKDYTLFIRVIVHCMAFSSVTGGLVLTVLIAHQKQYRKGNACLNWEKTFKCNAVTLKVKCLQGLIQHCSEPVNFSMYVHFLSWIQLCHLWFDPLSLCHRHTQGNIRIVKHQKKSGSLEDDSSHLDSLCKRVLTCTGKISLEHFLSMTCVEQRWGSKCLLCFYAIILVQKVKKIIANSSWCFYGRNLGAASRGWMLNSEEKSTIR